MNQPNLEFPLHWEYKIIAQSAPHVLEALCAVIASHGFDTIPEAGTASRHGSYTSYRLRVCLESRAQLDALTRSLAACEGVKYLL